MCDCVDIEMGSYDNQVTVWNPHYKTKEREFIEVDKCIAKELMKLWGLGIVTTGSCCGHNITVGYIGVTEEYKNIMRVMGYKNRFNDSRPDDDCSFIPKSIPDPLEIPVDITNLTVSEAKSIIGHDSVEQRTDNLWTVNSGKLSPNVKGGLEKKIYVVVWCYNFEEWSEIVGGIFDSKENAETYVSENIIDMQGLEEYRIDEWDVK